MNIKLIDGLRQKKYFKFTFYLFVLALINLISLFLYKAILPFTFVLTLVILALLTNQFQDGLTTKKTSRKYLPLFLSFVVIFIFFLIGRASFFIYYPIPEISVDYAGYYQIAYQTSQGEWPNFWMRTPGYPLFLNLVFAFSEKVMSVVIVQNIFTLITSLFLTYAIYKKYNWLSLLAAIAIGTFIAFGSQPTYDTKLMSESLYVNFLLLSAALFILAIHYNRLLIWVLCSITMAYVILIRPAGMFLIVIFILILIFFLARSYSKKVWVAFCAPFIGILFLLSLYNYFTLDSFTISTFGEYNLLGATIPFMEPDNTFSDETNACINEIKSKISKEHKQITYHSWDLKNITHISNKYFNLAYPLGGCLKKQKGLYTYKNLRPLFRKISFLAIRSHPDIYLKFIFAHLWGYFKNINARVDYHRWLGQRYKILFIDKNYASNQSEKMRKLYLKEFYNPSPSQSHKFKVEKVGKKYKVTLIPTSLQKVYSYLNKNVYSFLFRNTLWSILFLLVFAFSIFRLVQSKLCHEGAFIFFILACFPIGHALLISLVEDALLRYSYTLEFVYYLSIVFIPTLVKKCKNKATAC